MKIQKHKNFYFSFLEKNFTYKDKYYNSMNFAFNKGDSQKKVTNNRNFLSSIFGNKKIILVNQIHSNKIHIFDGKPYKSIEADGLISNKTNIMLAVLTADCAPVVIMGEQFYGILHAGWRGLVLDIIKKGVYLMIKKGERLKDIKVFVGPHLGKESFEVRSDFISNLSQYSKSEYFIENKNNRTFFNFTKMIKYKINELNIKNLKISTIDTYSNPKKFFSHRYYVKNGLKNCGRQISLVGINKKV